MNPTHELMAVLALIMAVCALLYAVVATRKRSLLSHIAAVEAALTRDFTTAPARVRAVVVGARLRRTSWPPTGAAITASAAPTATDWPRRWRGFPGWLSRLGLTLMGCPSACS